MTDKFMVFVPGNVPEGPLDTQDLAQRLTSGVLPDSTMVCRVGGEQWLPIHEVVPPPSPAVDLPPPVPMPFPPLAAHAAEAAPVAPQPTPVSPKSKKKLIIIASSALVVVIGGIAAVAVLHPKTEAMPAPSSVASSMSASELNLGFQNAPKTNTYLPPIGELFGFTQSEFQTHWSEATSKNNMAASPNWKMDPSNLLQLTTANTDLGGGIELETTALGHNDLMQIRMIANREAIQQAVRLLSAWKTLLIAIGHHPDDSDQRRVFEGLGLTNAPTAQWRRFTDAGVQFEVRYHDSEGTLALAASGQKVSLASPSDRFSLQVPTGVAPGAGKLQSFWALWDATTLGKTFQDGMQICRARGLYPCTEPQWTRVCLTDESISKVQSWTASFRDAGKSLFAYGGQPGCNGGTLVPSSEVAPNRGVLCCSRSIAVPESAPEPGNRVTLLPILQYETGTNLKDGVELSEAIGPTVVKFYTQTDLTKEQVVKMALDYLRSVPDSLSLHESCMPRENEAGLLLLRCRRNTFLGSKAIVVDTDYGFSKDSITLAWITDSVIRRSKAVY